MLLERFTELADTLAEAIAVELKGQGHVASGKLLNSIKSYIVANAGSIELFVEYNDYGKYINNNVRAASFKREIGRMEIKGLMNWIKSKGLSKNDKKDLSFAFAIAKTHRKRGLIAKGYSKNGKITGALDVNLVDLFNNVEQILNDYVKIKIDNLILTFTNSK